MSRATHKQIILGGSTDSRERLLTRALRLQKQAQINAPDILIRTEAWIIFRDLCGGTLQGILWAVRYRLWLFFGDVSFGVHIRACRIGWHRDYFGGYCACGKVGPKEEQTDGEQVDECAGCCYDNFLTMDALEEDGADVECTLEGEGLCVSYDDDRKILFLVKWDDQTRGVLH